jgi:hypothetical protein
MKTIIKARVIASFALSPLARADIASEVVATEKVASVQESYQDSEKTADEDAEVAFRKLEENDQKNRKKKFWVTLVFASVVAVAIVSIIVFGALKEIHPQIL